MSQNFNSHTYTHVTKDKMIWDRSGCHGQLLLAAMISYNDSYVYMLLKTKWLGIKVVAMETKHEDEINEKSLAFNAHLMLLFP